MAAIDKYTRITESCGGKGTGRPLSQEESAPTLAFAGFYCFSGHIVLRMVLLYSAQVHFRGLPFTENKGEGGGFSWGGVEGWGEKAYNCN